MVGVYAGVVDGGRFPVVFGYLVRVFCHSSTVAGMSSPRWLGGAGACVSYI